MQDPLIVSQLNTNCSQNCQLQFHRTYLNTRKEENHITDLVQRQSDLLTKNFERRRRGVRSLRIRRRHRVRAVVAASNVVDAKSAVLRDSDAVRRLAGAELRAVGKRPLDRRIRHAADDDPRVDSHRLTLMHTYVLTGVDGKTLIRNSVWLHQRIGFKDHGRL